MISAVLWIEQTTWFVQPAQKLFKEKIHILDIKVNGAYVGTG